MLTKVREHTSALGIIVAETAEAAGTGNLIAAARHTGELELEVRRLRGALYFEAELRGTPPSVLDRILGYEPRRSRA